MRFSLGYSINKKGTRTLPALVWLVLAGPVFGADQWLRLATPDFELYTDAGEKKGREAIQHFEQVRGFFAKASPVRPPADFPVRIIAFKTKEQFQAYTANPIAIAYFAGSPRRDYIVMQDPSPESYPIAIHEYMHLIIRHSGLRLPLWLNEGWADVYSTLRPVSDGVAVGDLIPARKQALAGGNWLDLETLNSIDSRSPAYHEADRVGVFYGESWALAHMLFLAPDYRDNFAKFVVALHRGKSLAEACQTAYGRSPAEMLEDLKTYLERRKIYGAVFKTSLGKSELQPEISPISDFDSRLVLADLLAAIQRFDEAKRQYEELDRLQPGRPEVTQSLGFLALQSRDNLAARQEFEKAFAAGDGDPQMCFLLAMLERDAKQPAAMQVQALERAVQSKPDYAEALFQLGLMKVAARDFEPAIKSLMSIPNVIPERATALFSALAYAYLETGDIERARKNMETARKWAKTPQETQGLTGLANLIEARAAGPYAVRPGEKMRRADGMLQTVDCSASGSRLQVQMGGRTATFALPQPAAVEYVHEGGGEPKLQCGPQKPFRVALDYVPFSVMEQAMAGVVRRIEY